MSVWLVEMSPEGCFLSLAAEGEHCQVHPGPEGAVQECPRSRVSSLSPLTCPNTYCWKLYDSKISLNRQKKPLCCLSLATVPACLCLKSLDGHTNHHSCFLVGDELKPLTVCEMLLDPLFGHEHFQRYRAPQRKTLVLKLLPVLEFCVITAPDSCCPCPCVLKSG